MILVRILLSTILISMVLFFLYYDSLFILNLVKERLLSFFLFIPVIVFLKFLYKHFEISVYEIFTKYLKNIDFFICLYNYLALLKEFQIKLSKIQEYVKFMDPFKKKCNSFINLAFYSYSIIYLFGFYNKNQINIVFLEKIKIICFLIFIFLFFFFKFYYWFNIYTLNLKFLYYLLSKKNIDTREFNGIKTVIISKVSFFILFEAFFLCFFVLIYNVFFNFDPVIHFIIRFLFYISLNRHFVGFLNKVIYSSFFFLINFLIF